MSHPVHLVLQQLSSFHPLSAELNQEFLDNSFDIFLKKNDYLMRKGELSSHVYFVIKGIISGQITNKEKTITSFITVDGEFLSAIEGMYGDKPCVEDVRAEEDSYLVAMSSTYFHSLYDLYPEMNVIFRKVLEMYYGDAHYRSIFIRMGSVEDKYIYFLRTFPEHAERIPIEVAASFMNIKTATLLKMIGKMNAGKTLNQQLSKEDIIESMDRFKYYLQKKLTLKQLADLLNTSPHHLSYLLNEHFNENFNSFVNRLRINYILEQLSIQDNLQQYSIDGLGRQAGFSSKTTFFCEFKKRMGLTPYTYSQQNNTVTSSS
ncbi:helix-turn-helix domain-containing protein [Pedobacter caeni]|uniref:Two-component response regulator, YesN/AraC family, consists of REC and AraC-type DNA-binding domains n=1 Tax=Pedobacter caeni TaxID=288992 RepID=A0A1M5A434_9SPHI|nr:helix-turn-helix domain-containing protein [Pedobacter caeni]SHF24994.1 Two-component response regulator, YesN/AraC family, consists of REC and AraC-type DNA-binding domains [Pedobacter caeni]